MTDDSVLGELEWPYLSLQSQVGYAGVLLGARVRRRVAFETSNYRDEVSERRKVIVNSLIS